MKILFSFLGANNEFTVIFTIYPSIFFQASKHLCGSGSCVPEKVIYTHCIAQTEMVTSYMGFQTS